MAENSRDALEQFLIERLLDLTHRLRQVVGL